MVDKLRFSLEVDDKGTAKIVKFSKESDKLDKKVIATDKSLKKYNTTVDKTSTKTGKATTAYGKFSNKVSGSLSTLSSLTSTVAVLAGTAGFAGLATSIVTTGAQFERTMATVGGVSRTIIDGEMTPAFYDLRDAARLMGEQTEFSANQSAEGLQFLSQAGFTAEQSIAALPGVLDLATAGNLDLGRAADIASNALSAMKLPVEELGRVNDVLVGTTTRTNTNIDQMAEALRYAAPSAAAFGYSIEDISALIGELGNAGIQGSMAGTQLSFAMTKVNDVFEELGTVSGKEVVDVLKKMNERGVEAKDVLADIEENGGNAHEALKPLGIKEGTDGKSVVDALTQMTTQGLSTKDMLQGLKEKGGPAHEVIKQLGIKGSGNDLIDALGLINENGLSTNEIMDIFGDRAGRAALVLKDLIPQTNSLSIELGNADGEAKSLADTMRDTLMGQFATFKSTLEGIGLDIFDENADNLKSTMEDMVGWLRANKDAFVEFGTGAGEVLGDLASVVGLLAGVFTTTVEGWNSLPAPVKDLGVIAAVVGGAKARAAILALSTMVGVVKENIEKVNEPTEILNNRMEGLRSRIAYAEREAKKFGRNTPKYVDKLRDELKKLEDQQDGNLDGWHAYSDEMEKSAKREMVDGIHAVTDEMEKNEDQIKKLDEETENLSDTNDDLIDKIEEVSDKYEDGSEEQINAIQDVIDEHNNLSDTNDDLIDKIQEVSDKYEDGSEEQIDAIQSVVDEHEIAMRKQEEDADSFLRSVNSMYDEMEDSSEDFANNSTQEMEDFFNGFGAKSEDAAGDVELNLGDMEDSINDLTSMGDDNGELSDFWKGFGEQSEDAADDVDEAAGNMLDSFNDPTTGFFAGVNKEFENMTSPNGSLTTWADTGEGIVKGFTSSTQTALSDSLINWMTGEEGVTINTAWTTFWQGMLGTVVEYVAKMVAEWATVELLEGASTVIDLFSAATGAFNVPEDQLMWVHAGEMIVPAQTAGDIRDAVGDGGVNISPFSPSFNAEAGNQFATDFASSMVGRYTQASLAGGVLAAGGYIDAAELGSALVNLDFAGLSLRNSFVDALKSSLGLTGGWAKMGSAFGKAGALFGGFGPMASLFGVGGAVIGDAMGDLANLRENELMRDFLEDMHGYIGGRAQYKKLAEWMYGKGDYGSDSDWRPTGDGGIIITEPGVGEIIINEPGSAGDPRPSDGSGGGMSDSDIGPGPSDEFPDFATGGLIDRVIKPRGREDGMIAAQLGEGVVSKQGMKALDKINNGNFGNSEIHVHLHVDGNEIGEVVIDQLRTNGELVEAIRTI